MFNNNNNNNNNNRPTGNNNQKKNNKKRKTRTLPVPTEEEWSGKKPRTDPQPASSQAMGPPAQPGFGFGNPQMTNPAAYAPLGFPYAGFPPSAIGSTAFAPQYPHSQGLPQWPQQQPPYVPQPGGYHPGYHMQPMLNPSNMGLAAGQQQVTPQAPEASQNGADSSKKLSKKPIEMYKVKDAVLLENSGDGRAPNVGHKAFPNKTNIVFETPLPDTTLSRSIGDQKNRDVIGAQIGHLQTIHEGGSELFALITARPLMARTAPAMRVGEATESTVGLAIPNNRGPRRQRPGTAPAPAQAQAAAQDQGQAACPNCDREGHLVGDCVGPPNAIHGDLPACPTCETFAGKARNGKGSPGHRFDDCPQVGEVLYSHSWEKNHRLTPEDLTRLSDGQLELFFRALIMRRLRKSPIRTQLVCWIELLREIVRRSGSDSAAIKSLGDMTPWTKDFARQQRNVGAQQVTPWAGFDYARGDVRTLPPGPLEQSNMSWENFVGNATGLPPQVFNSNDRPQASDKMQVDTASTVDSPKPQDAQAVAQQPQQGQQPAAVPNMFAPQQQGRQVPNMFAQQQQGRQVPNMFAQQQPQQQGQQPAQVPNLFAQQQQQQQQGHQAPILFGQQPPQTAATGLGAPPPRQFGDDVLPARTPGLFTGSPEAVRSATQAFANRPPLFSQPANRPSAADFFSSPATAAAPRPGPNTAYEGSSGGPANAGLAGSMFATQTQPSTTASEGSSDRPAVDQKLSGKIFAPPSAQPSATVSEASSDRPSVDQKLSGKIFGLPARPSTTESQHTDGVATEQNAPGNAPSGAQSNTAPSQFPPANFEPKDGDAEFGMAQMETWQNDPSNTTEQAANIALPEDGDDHIMQNAAPDDGMH